MARHATDHAEVDEVDDPVFHDDVPRMGVRMEKTVLEHLRGVIVHNGRPDLFEAIARPDKEIGIGDGDAVHIIHDHDVLGAVRKVGTRAGYGRRTLVKAMEVIEVAGLHEEIRLLAKRLPQLLDHALEVDELVGFHKARRMAHNRTHDVDILGHHLLGTGTLHLDGNVFASHERGTMHLCERGTAQGPAVDMGEDLVKGATVLGDEAIMHHGKRHRLDIRAQAAKLVAVFLR